MADRKLPDLVAKIKLNSSELDLVQKKAQATGVQLQQGIGGGAKKGAKQLEEATHHSATLLGETGGHVDDLSKRLGALQGLMNSGLGTALLGMATGAAVGIGVEAAQSAISISEQQEAAEKSLEQAAGTGTANLVALKNVRDDFIQQNTHFIESQSEVTEGFASMARAGLTVDQTTRDMNIALDLSKLKHISLSDAVTTVIAAEQGRGKALISLGINVKNLNAENAAAAKSQAEVAKAQQAATRADENLIQAKRHLAELEDSLHGKRTLSKLDMDHLQDAENAVKKATDDDATAHNGVTDAMAKNKAQIDVQNQVMQELADKTKNGRDTTTQMEQAQNDLSNQWQTLSGKVGPPLVELLSQIIEGAANIFDSLSAFGKDDSAWKWINDITIAALKLLTPLHDIISTAHTIGSIFGSAGAKSNVGAYAYGTAGRASGGPVLAGQPYWVGEQGPELMVPDTDGTIIPSQQSGAAAAARHTHLTLVGTPVVNDPDGVRRMLRRMELIGAAS